MFNDELLDLNICWLDCFRLCWGGYLPLQLSIQLIEFWLQTADVLVRLLDLQIQSIRFLPCSLQFVNIEFQPCFFSALRDALPASALTLSARVNFRRNPVYVAFLFLRADANSSASFSIWCRSSSFRLLLGCSSFRRFRFHFSFSVLYPIIRTRCLSI